MILLQKINKQKMCHNPDPANASKNSQNLSSEIEENIQNIIPEIININLKEEDKPKELNETEKKIEAEKEEEKVKEVIDDLYLKDIENEVMDEMEKEMKKENENDSDDEDKWIPKYKDCPCCYGFVYKCKGDTCASLGQCFCKMKDDVEEEEKKEVFNNDNDNEFE